MPDHKSSHVSDAICVDNYIYIYNYVIVISIYACTIFGIFLQFY